MKKAFLKISLSLTAIALLFASCLGDNESSFEVQNDFSYVTTDSYGIKYAAVWQQLVGITSPEISNLSNGCYEISYKITQTSATSSGYYAAEVTSTKRIPTNTGDLHLLYAAPTTVTNELYSTSFAVKQFSPYSLLGDNWWYSVTSKIADGERVHADFYYDPTNQRYGTNNTETTSNQMVIDIVLRIDNVGGELISTSKKAVQSFNDIRQYVVNNGQNASAGNGNSLLVYNDSGNAEFRVIFRLRQLDSTTGGTKTVYYPETFSSTPALGFVMSRAQ